jgi:hypothetical protein
LYICIDFVTVSAELPLSSGAVIQEKSKPLPPQQKQQTKTALEQERMFMNLGYIQNQKNGMQR